MVELKKLASAGRALAFQAMLLLAVPLVSAADIEIPPPALSFTLEPGVAIPLGPGAEYFLPGTVFRVGAEYTLPSLPMLSLRANAIYGFAPIVSGLGTTSVAGGVLGARWRVPIVGRLSAVAYAGAGYALGVINGDSSSSASMLVAEGGVGLSWLLNPNAALRLDSSYFYALGANGSMAISLGLVVRPWSAAARPVIQGREKTGLQIEGVSLDTVYSLARPILRQPSGWTGADPQYRPRIRLRRESQLPGFRCHGAPAGIRCEERAETRRNLAGAPQHDPRRGNAAAATASSTESEVIVTFVEGGEQWELRRTASLDIQASHVVAADDPATAAAFVSPTDPALRNLTGSISEALGGPVNRRGGTIGTRRVCRPRGRPSPWPSGRPGSRHRACAGEKAEAVRRMKYPGETLHDRGGNSGTSRCSSPLSWRRPGPGPPSSRYRGTCSLPWRRGPLRAATRPSWSTDDPGLRSRPAGAPGRFMTQRPRHCAPGRRARQPRQASWCLSARRGFGIRLRVSCRRIQKPPRSPAGCANP